jgi:hypothetical protein
MGGRESYKNKALESCQSGNDVPLRWMGKRRLWRYLLLGANLQG